MANFIELKFSKEEPIKVDFGMKFERLSNVILNVEKIIAFTFFENKGYGVLETDKDLLYIDKETYSLLKNTVLK